MKLPKSKQGQSKAHDRAPLQEKAAAKRYGGKITPGSGSGKQKGDVRVTGVLLMECKCTIHKSFSLTEALVQKIDSEAVANGELPVMEIELNCKKKKPTKVVVMPAWAFDILYANATKQK